jgi:SulP family sulfate permease
VLQIDESAMRSELQDSGRSHLPSDVLVYSIEGPFFFGAVETLERALIQTRTDPRCIVIRLGRVPFMDITGIQALEEAIRNLERRGVRVLLCEARPNVLRKLVRARLARKRTGPRSYFKAFGVALRACDPSATSTVSGIDDPIARDTK